MRPCAQALLFLFMHLWISLWQLHNCAHRSGTLQSQPSNTPNVLDQVLERLSWQNRHQNACRLRPQHLMCCTHQVLKLAKSHIKCSCSTVQLHAQAKPPTIHKPNTNMQSLTADAGWANHACPSCMQPMTHKIRHRCLLSLSCHEQSHIRLSHRKSRSWWTLTGLPELL